MHFFFIFLLIYLDNTREKFESEMNFLGLLVLENSLKENANKIISSLN